MTQPLRRAGNDAAGIARMASKKKKLPFIPLYTGDWMKDPAVRSVSLAARGLWIDMLCLMSDSTRRGYLQHTTGKPVTAEQIARMTGCSTDEVSPLLAELQNSGVYSVTNAGVIFSRRLVRDEKLRDLRRKCGQLGGNPLLKVLVNQKANQNSTISSSISSSTSVVVADSSNRAKRVADEAKKIMEKQT